MKKNARIVFNWRIAIGAVLPLVLSFTSNVLHACPACSDAVAQQTKGLGEGLSYTVVGMAAMPFLLFASVASVIIRSYFRRLRSAPDDISMK